jgi:peptidoglycan/xylan/chitin deacetylase (PgdA/CDA1 family)
MPTLFLTFDDGPAETTELVLNALAEHDARATFFQVGRSVVERPDLAKRAFEEGHAAGNHSWSHENFEDPAVDVERIRAELEDASEAIGRITGKRPTLFRPPYGRPWMTKQRGPTVDGRRRLVEAEATRLDLRVVLWDVDPSDWNVAEGDQRTAEQVADEVIRGATDGAVVLLHDIHLRTAAAVPMILRELGSRGYTFEPLPPTFVLIRTLDGLVRRTSS